MPRFIKALLLVPFAMTLLLLAGGPGTSSDIWGWQRASADSYVVQPGDTLSDIADCLSISESVLRALNLEITSPNLIYVGQSIQIPANASGQSCGSGIVPTQSNPPAVQPPQTIGNCTYIVKGGDFISTIADRIGSDTATILSLNPTVDPNLLWVGHELIIPCQSTRPADVDSASVGIPAGVVADPAPRLQQRTVQHTVQRGDNLSAIADQYDLTLDELLAHNGLEQTSVIHPGDEISIPVPDHQAPALDPSEAVGVITALYTVRQGDIAASIARRHGITLAELIQLNGGRDLNLIRPGDALTVPWTNGPAFIPPGTVPAVEQRRRTYRVAAGDTFSSIAQAHGLSREELRNENPFLPRELVVVGGLLYLPGSIDPPAVAKVVPLAEADVVQYAAAKLGVTPHTLLANHAWLSEDQWLSAGSEWRLPLREGRLVTVQRGDTLRAIADRHGVSLDLILEDPRNGVDDPNAIVIGQEIILPLAMPEFSWPAFGEQTDPFGQCRNWDCSYRHKGLDLALDFYEPILAAADGVVTFVGGDSLFGLGFYIDIEHDHGWTTTYAHLVDFNVYEGQRVTRGDVIGYNGSTGHSTGPHLHFEVRHDDWYVDPLVVLPG